MKWEKKSFNILIYITLSYLQATWSSYLTTVFPVDAWLWSWFCNLEYKRSCLKKENWPKRKLLGCVELAARAERKRFAQSFIDGSKNLYTARKYGDAGRISLKCRLRREGVKQVTIVRKGTHWVSVGRLWLEHGYSASTKHFVFSFNVQRFWDSFNGWRLDCDWRWGRMKILLPPY